MTSALYLLTERQKECLRLVAEGRKNLDVAMSLGIAESTAKEHIEKATKSLGARNRRHAASLLAQHEKVGLNESAPPFWPVGKIPNLPAFDVSTEAVVRDGEGIPPNFMVPPHRVIERARSNEELSNLLAALTIVAIAAGLVIIISNYPKLVSLAESLAAFIAKSVHH